MRVRLESQVADFIRKQAPDSRRRLRDALRGLARGQGDIKGLEPPLEDYQRLRVGPFRIVLRHADDHLRCVFAERRGIVYEVFSDMIDRFRP